MLILTLCYYHNAKIIPHGLQYLQQITTTYTLLILHTTTINPLLQAVIQNCTIRLLVLGSEHYLESRNRRKMLQFERIVDYR